MSNAKLKEQIEAAKIALVHSAEPVAPMNTVQQNPEATKTHTSDMDPGTKELKEDNAQAGADDGDLSPGHNQAELSLSEYEALEERIVSLENQIKDQQRDLHTLLQKLRDVTAKSKNLAEAGNKKSSTKWAIGLFILVLVTAGVYFTAGPTIILSKFYDGIGWAIGLIDMLSKQI